MSVSRYIQKLNLKATRVFGAVYYMDISKLRTLDSDLWQFYRGLKQVQKIYDRTALHQGTFTFGYLLWDNYIILAQTGHYSGM